MNMKSLLSKILNSKQSHYKTLLKNLKELNIPISDMELIDLDNNNKPTYHIECEDVKKIMKYFMNKKHVDYVGTFGPDENILVLSLKPQ